MSLNLPDLPDLPVTPLSETEPQAEAHRPLTIGGIGQRGIARDARDLSECTRRDVVLRIAVHHPVEELFAWILASTRRVPPSGNERNSEKSKFFPPGP